ncbi:MAG: iron-containing alcohol dehydrogenase [Planctomycetia bacterium]|nr:iron-containing alcohol dehydrogenase [Planctomycetia bacterium]
MGNFSWYAPTRIVFGKGTIAEISHLIPEDSVVLMTYGGGSIRRNGVYDQVAAALSHHTWYEFGGIEPNPHYETCMKALEMVREKGVTFLLAVGGGSTLDGTKFIGAAHYHTATSDPWDILARGASVERMLPIGCVMTLPATGSEMNGNAVVTRESTREKLAFFSDLACPQFSVLDPETTMSLPTRQTVNGIVDTFTHVSEQYMTDDGAPLQDRQAEAIYAVLLEEGPKILKDPGSYECRANLMWAATHGLNKLIACGVREDWVTHMIGHEITAFYGLDHGQTLAIVLPAIWEYRRSLKGRKLAQFAERLFGATGSVDSKIDAAISGTREFFESLGAKTRLSAYGVDAAECAERIRERFNARGVHFGEDGKITGEDIPGILTLSR